MTEEYKGWYISACRVGIKGAWGAHARNYDGDEHIGSGVHTGRGAKQAAIDAVKAEIDGRVKVA